MGTQGLETQSEEEDLLPEIYTQVGTGLVFEVKFFEDFVLVRPATPLFYTAIKKMCLDEFYLEFEEFGGDIKTVRACLRGMTPDFIVERAN